MKTSKRKRSAKAASAVEAKGVDAVIVARPVEQSSPGSVASLLAGPLAAELPAEAVAELADPTAETIVVEVIEAAAVAESAQAGDPIVVLAANCSVKDAAVLKTSLCALARQSTPVTVDVSAVERVDTATMQLLCAFARDRSGRNQSIAWRGESQALKNAVRLLGVDALLGFDSKGVAA